MGRPRCRDNAANYANNPDVIGVIGTYNSGCAAEIIPILNKAPDGGVAMVSPGNTLVCLTETASTCEPGQPDSLYPSGTRNYARVVPNDAIQGAGLASFAQKQGVRKPYVLYAADDPTSAGQGSTFAGAAKGLGMEVAGFEPWDPDAASYTDLMQKVKATGRRRGGARRAARAERRPDHPATRSRCWVPTTGGVKLLAPDGFAQQATIDGTGPPSAGMFVSVPGRPPETLTGPGKTFVSSSKAELGGAPVELFAPYAGQAAAGPALGDRAQPGPRRRDRGACSRPEVDGWDHRQLLDHSHAATRAPAPISVSVPGTPSSSIRRSSRPTA